MTDWVRLWHDMPTDPKWRVIARKSGQPLACVIAVFNLMMVSASGNADNRGTLLAWDDEDAGAALDMDSADIGAIRDAMQGKVLDGDRLTGWDRRQPKREDNSVGRVRAYRERKATEANAVEREETQPDDVKRDVTHGNAPEKSRAETEKIIPFSNENGVVDSDKEFWSSAKAYLGKSSGGLINKWLRDHQKADLAKAITAAQLERAVDPVAYITKTLARARASPEFSSPC